MTKATDWSYEREYRVEAELKDEDPILRRLWAPAGVARDRHQPRLPFV